MNERPYQGIIEFCKDLLAEQGDTPAGMGWKLSDGDVRYRVMLDLLKQDGHQASLLDFGCGAGHLLEYMQRTGTTGVDYVGLDISEQAIALCRSKFPGQDFLCLDVMAADSPQLGEYDYMILNGIFTYKGALGQDEMFGYCKSLLRKVFKRARIGIAFNVASKQVDWERDDLFHLPVDQLLDFLSRELSRHVVIRHDYGLYEYTAYVYHEAFYGSHPGMKNRIGRELGG